MDYKLFYDNDTKTVEVFDFEADYKRSIGYLELDDEEITFTPDDYWTFSSSDLLKLGAFLSELEDNNTIKSLLI